MFKELERRMFGHSKKLEVFNKVLGNIKNLTELKNTINDILNTPKGIKSRLDDIEEWISELEAEQWKSLKLKRWFNLQINQSDRGY